MNVIHIDELDADVARSVREERAAGARDEPYPVVYEKSYECDSCGACWTDWWGCECNDPCPVCGVETEPHDSVQFKVEGLA